VEQRQAVLVGERGQRGQLRTGGEALDPVVGGVDGEDGAARPAERLGVVVQVGAVGGADLDQRDPGGLHDRGQAELTADLDQLATRHHHFTATRQAAEGQQQRPGRVVGDQRRRRPGRLAQQRLGRRAAPPAPASREVVLDRGIPGRLHDRHPCRLRQGSPAQVGVQHHTGRVEHRPGPPPSGSVQLTRHLRGQLSQLGHLAASGQVAAARLQHPPDHPEHWLAPQPPHPPGELRVGQQQVNFGQCPSWIRVHELILVHLDDGGMRCPQPRKVPRRGGPVDNVPAVRPNPIA